MMLTLAIILAGAGLYFGWRRSDMGWRRVVANAGGVFAMLWGLLVVVWIVTHWGSAL